MDSGTNLKPEITMESLSKKIDDQFRFTRSVIFLCTCLILGVVFYILVQLYEGIPEMVIARFMSNMEPLVKEARAADSNIRRQEEHKVVK
jgi:hypothetical protein